MALARVGRLACAEPPTTPGPRAESGAYALAALQGSAVPPCARRMPPIGLPGSRWCSVVITPLAGPGGRPHQVIRAQASLDRAVIPRYSEARTQR